MIFDRVWGYDFGYGSNSLDVYISYLRKKDRNRRRATADPHGPRRRLRAARAVSLAAPGIVSLAAAARAAVAWRRPSLASVIVYFIVRRRAPRAGRPTPPRAGAARSHRRRRALTPGSGRAVPRSSAAAAVRAARSSSSTATATSTPGAPYGTAAQVRLPGIDAGAATSRAGDARTSTREGSSTASTCAIYTTPLPARVRVAGRDAADDVDRELARSGSGCCSSRSAAIGLAPRALGFLVARAALAPVRELSETAERVRDDARPDAADRGDRQRRAQPARGNFNAMLESLDEAQQRQRQLVQDASHELRTPLTSLRTNIEVLASTTRFRPRSASSCSPTSSRSSPR